MKIKNYKLIECTLDEYNLIKSLAMDHCLKEAIDLLLDIMKRTNMRLEYNKEELKDISYNCIQAVSNNYKYLKVIKERK